MSPAFLSALGLALAFSAMPGPITAEAFRRGTAVGMRSVMLLRLGALVGAIAWAAAVPAGMGAVMRIRPLYLLIGLAGALLTLRMAWFALAAARRAIPMPTAANSRGDFMAGMTISLLSPGQAAFWLGISGTLAARPGSRPDLHALALFFTGFGAGHLLFTAALTAAIGAGRHLLGGSFHRWAQAFCGIALGVFGLRLLLTIAQVA